jgi:hypothetical protein
VSTYPAKVNPVQPVMTSKPSRFMPVFATTSIPENPLQTVQPAKPIPRVAVQPAKLITSPPVAQEGMLKIVLANRQNWNYRPMYAYYNWILYVILDHTF